MIICCLFLLSACTHNDMEEKNLHDEGVDTPLEIIDYRSLAIADFSFLKEGDKIAVISPSAYPSVKQRDAVMKGLKDWGYEPIEGKYTVGEVRTLDNVVEDLRWALNDPEIKAIFCIRGGSAASEVVDHLGIGIIREKRKPIIGFSDIGAFLNAWVVSDVPSIHATMASAFIDADEKSVEAEKHLLKGEIPVYQVEGNEHDRQGTAEGILIGGNLSVILSILSSSADPTKINEPYILFIEDVAEDMEHIHRYLTLLKHEGILDKAAGLIFGEFTELPAESNAYNGNSRGGKFSSIADMIDRQILGDLKIPVAFNFPAGHASVNYPLLFGCRLKLDVKEDHYTLEWQ